MATDRIALARRIIDFGLEPGDLGDTLDTASRDALLHSQPGAPAGGFHPELIATQKTLAEHFPAGLAPVPHPISPAPDPEAPLPQADYVVMTWTVAEQTALADVFTPGVSREKWHPYAEGFTDRYLPQIRSGAPARAAHRLGSYLPVTIGDKSVLVVKSELHLNQDGISDKANPGTATLPVRDFMAQVIAEAQPKLFVTTGTAGAVYTGHELGDVMVTRAARFRCRQEFRNEPWASTEYRSDWTVGTSHFDDAAALLALHADKLVEPDFGPPTTRYPGGIVPGHHNTPDIKLDGRDFAAFHPILTTDYFEFGTSTNGLQHQGCGVEMGDAVLGLVASGLADPPRWLVVRNASDPQINGHLPTDPDVQAMWAVWFYEQYGYWTTVSSAIATWAIIAGDEG